MTEANKTESLPSIESEAARWASVLPQPSCRISRTETFWYYRSYQGGEPYHIIDWRQSGRCDQLLVREHDPIIKKPVILWADQNEEDRETQIFLLALARLLIANDRTVCWLGPQPIPSNKIDYVEEQRGLAKKEAINRYIQEGLAPFQSACFVLAAPFAARSEQWRQKLKSFASQGIKGLLIDTSRPSLPRHSGLYKRAQNLGWPVILHRNGDNMQNHLPAVLSGILEISL